MYKQEFINYLNTQGIEDYKHTIGYYLTWASQSGIDVLAPTYTTVIDFVNHNIQAGVSSGTINNRIKAMRKYYKFLLDIGKVTPDIVDQVRKFKNITYR